MGRDGRILAFLFRHDIHAWDTCFRFRGKPAESEPTNLTILCGGEGSRACVPFAGAADVGRLVNMGVGCSSARKKIKRVCNLIRLVW